MDNRLVGALVLALVLLLGFVVWSYDQAVVELSEGYCEAEKICPHQQAFETQRSIILGLTMILFILGLALFLKPGLFAGFEARAPETREKPGKPFTPKDSGALSEEEKSVYNVVVEAGGSAYQGDVVKKTGFSKVRVSRVLDRLEQKGFLERRRRGMANLVIAK